MKSLRETAVVGLILLALACVYAYFAQGCKPALEKTAEATYLGQQLECVDNLQTKADIDGCRDSVKRRWAKDAGKDAP